MILEDDAGFLNAVGQSGAFEETVVFVKISSFLGVTGTIKSRDGIVHVGELPRHPALELPPPKTLPTGFAVGPFHSRRVSLRGESPLTGSPS